MEGGQGGMELKEFHDVPSPSFFSSQIESKCIPAVIRGCVKEWPAITKWNPSKGGLDYLQTLVGSSSVEAMLSRSGPVFYGDIKSHERVSLAFSNFVSYCRKSHSHSGETSILDNSNVKSEVKIPVDLDEACPLLGEALSHVYLAQINVFLQKLRGLSLEVVINYCVASISRHRRWRRCSELMIVPLFSVNKDTSSLHALQADFEPPSLLGEKCFSSINFWMNNTQSRSSSHYDPHNNLLCIVSGYKKVCLWPPSAIPSLYPLPLYGESSNHSAVDIEHPDFSIHPRAKELAHCSHHVTLAAGDALFIPEGWFHQVDSSDLTIAVNFWWQSDIMLAMKEHMDGYYLRIILKRLMDNEMKRELNGNYEENRNSEEKSSCQPIEREQEDAGCSSFREAKPCVIPSSSSHNDFETKQSACTRNLDWKGQQLEPEASQILHQLVSVVHEKVIVSSQGQMVYSDASQNGSNRVGDQTLSECEPVSRTEEHSFSLGNDPVACILRSVEPLTLQRVFCVMVQSFPRTLEALVLHVLSPPAAEILTQKFDEMDEFTTKEEQMHFYRLFYGIFEDQGAAMDAILNGKEAFGFQVLRNVLHQHLGVMCHRTGELFRGCHK